ncbi:hypothetical protein ACHAWF_012841 [Thalassiosira exigua]
MTSAAAPAIAAAFKYTYIIGRNLYVPLTSRSNSVPLPSTRGPGFLLPRSVADALLRIRDAESERPAGPAAGSGPGAFGDWLDEDDRVCLPPYDLPLVNDLYTHNDDLSWHLERQRRIRIKQAEKGYVFDDELRPSIATLVDEVSSRLDADDANFHEVVIAGEGEPTLRMDALLAVARRVKSHRERVGVDQAGEEQSQAPAVRVITNGLCYAMPNLGYSPQNLDRDGRIMPMHRHTILMDMTDAGVSRFSVALNTENRHQYDVLMEPSCLTGWGAMGGETRKGRLESGKSEGIDDGLTVMPGTAHDVVCEFILEVAKLGMEVEITGVARPDVVKREVNRLAHMLLSASPNPSVRKKRVRWRSYFD